MRETRHIGDQGTRVVVTGVVLTAERTEHQYGNGTLFEIEGHDGTLARWHATAVDAYDWKVGDPITVRATVDGYVDRGGDRWVRITRGTIEENALALF